jgi:hypothetical protein
MRSANDDGSAYPRQALAAHSSDRFGTDSWHATVVETRSFRPATVLRIGRKLAILPQGPHERVSRVRRVGIMETGFRTVDGDYL